MELNEVIRSRRSVRRFLDTPIKDNVINDILENAKLAPETDSCFYYFGVVKDNELKKQIAKATCWADWVQKAPVIFVCCSDISSDLKDKKEDSYAVCGMTMRYGSDIVQFLRESEDRKACKTLMQSTPVYIAAQHMILTAVSRGLRGCLVDFIDIEKINEILGLPEHITCELLVPIGYPDEIPKAKNNQERENLVFYDKWE